MALALDASTPAAVVGSLATTTTAAFSPPASSLLVAQVMADANSGVTTEQCTVTSTGGLTWTLKLRDNGSPGAVVETWSAPCVAAPGSITVSVTDNQGAVAKRLYVGVWTDAGNGIPAGLGASNKAAANSVSYTSTVANSLGIDVGLAGGGPTAAGAGQTLLDSDTTFDGGDGTFVTRQNAVTATPGTTVTMSPTPTGTAIHHIAVEILPASTATYPPGRVRRGRLAVPVRARRRTTGPVPAQVVIAAPAYPPKPVHLLRQVLGRVRGRTATPVPAQVVVAAPAYPPQPRAGRRAALLRQSRRRAFAPVLDQVVVPPVVARRARQLFARLRGRSSTTAVPGQTALLPAPHPRRPAAPTRRGKAAGPVPPQVQVTAPTWTPAASHSRRFAALGRRGKTAAPVPPQITVLPPTYTPAVPRRTRQILGRVRGRVAAPTLGQQDNAPSAPTRRLRAVAARIRGRSTSPVPPQTVVTPPTYPPSPVHRLRAVLGRTRGRPASPAPAQTVVAPPAYPPKPVHRLRQVLGRVHGRTAAPVPPQIVIPAPPYPPAAKRRRLGWLLPRRSRIAAHPITCDCTCHRPTTGTTARPGSGTTVYNTATTARPGAGTTARPDTGTTQDPCC